MRIVVAPDAFKGTLSASEAAAAMAAGIRESLPDAEVIELPLADGGEGTAAVLAPHIGDQVCLIESAQMIGLHQSEMQALDVMRRGSGLLGKAILEGLDRGARDFVIALGGSATNDGGLGMLMELGMQAMDQAGQPVEPNLDGLLSLDSVETGSLDARLTECHNTVLVDVTSPLYGKNGATAVFGPQKGIPAEDIERVDHAMQRFAEKCSRAFGSDFSRIPGAGAAGGLGFALMLLGGEIVSGAEFVMNASRFSSRLTDVDWVITGEGRSDAQTLAGKLPMVVAQLARQQGRRVAIISGTVDEAARSALSGLADVVMEVSDRLPVDSQQAHENLRSKAAQFSHKLVRF